MVFEATVMDRSAYLKLSLFVDDDDGTAELSAQVFSNGFSGHGAAFFNARDVHAFGELLASTYPIAKEHPIELLGGHWYRDGSGVEKVHLGLRFYPIDGTGKVGVRVQLVDARWNDAWPEGQSQLILGLTTHYEALRRFGEAVCSMAQGHCVSAELGTIHEE